MNQEKYIGMDIHQATISVAVMEGRGKLIMECILETKAATILEFMHGLHGSVSVTFEEGTSAAWLHDLLKPHVAHLVVCDPRKNALLKDGSKSDRIDARKLAELLRLNQLHPVYHGEHGVRTLKELGRSYLTISQDLTRVMNRIKALYRSWAIPCSGSTVYAPHHRAAWLGEIRKAMNNVYVHGQRQGLLTRTQDGNPISFVRQSLASDFEPVILTLPQVLDIFDNLDLMRRTMILTDAATALRVSEVLALQWDDLDFEAQLIRVRRAYVERRFGEPKSKASKAPVPMHPLLAAHLLAWRRETLYPAAEDFVFPSLRLKGKKPPAANMLVADYLRVAAKKAGVVAPPRTFGFHTFRRTLASVLVNMKVDIKTVQEILRHQNLKTTLEIYAKAMSEDKLAAQGMFLEKLFSQEQKKKSPQDVVSAKDLERIEPVVSSLQ